MDAQLKEGLVAQFVGVTGTTTERANFFLECAEWNCDLALENFYDSHQEEMPMALESDEERVPPTVAVNQPAPPTRSGVPTSKAQSSNRIATFGNLRHNDQGSDEEEEEDNNEQEAFYAGGSERGSGQQVLGPKKNVNKLVAGLFKGAKDHGGEFVQPGNSSDGQRQPRHFQGTAYRLGGENDPGATIPAAAQDATLQEVHFMLKLWINGFSINDGPLREFQDPDGKEFLDEIRQGKVPKELLAQTRGAPVIIDMEDHCQEEYVKPKVVMQAFSGQGHRLGNPTDGCLVSATMSTSGSSVDHQPSLGAVAAASSVQLDESLPVTNLQIRMPDGSKLVSKFNHSHTVADVRQYIVQNRPSFSSSNFVLMTTFPNKEITDESSTLQAANLINTVLVVRMK